MMLLLLLLLLLLQLHQRVTTEMAQRGLRVGEKSGGGGGVGGGVVGTDGGGGDGDGRRCGGSAILHQAQLLSHVNRNLRVGGGGVQVRRRSRCGEEGNCEGNRRRKQIKVRRTLFRSKQAANKIIVKLLQKDLINIAINLI